MCGRFTLLASMEELSRMFDAPASGELAPRRNIAPSQTILAVRISAETGRKGFIRPRWGLIPASGFYEWRRAGGKKVPYLVRMRNGGPFALAGLWEPGRGAEGEPVETCAILTTEHNSVVSPLHDRMPVIVGPEWYDRWLAPGEGTPDSLKPVFAPWSPEGMEASPFHGTFSPETEMRNGG